MTSGVNPMPIELQLDQGNRSCLVKIDGNFDVSLSSELLPVSRDIPTSVRDISIDLMDTQSLDATAIANLVMLYSGLGTNRTIRIVNCSVRVARVLTISGVSRLMTVYLRDMQPVEYSTIKGRIQDRHLNTVIA